MGVGGGLGWQNRSCLIKFKRIRGKHHCGLPAKLSVEIGNEKMVSLDRSVMFVAFVLNRMITVKLP